MRIALAAAFALVTSTALAADFGAPPVLRGALGDGDKGIDWGGAYVGGFYGFTQGNAPSLSAGRLDPLLATLVEGSNHAPSVRAMPPVEVGRRAANGPGFGIFAGVNWGYDEAVFGIEADYTRSRQVTQITGSRAGSFSEPNGAGSRTYSWLVNTQRQFAITEYGTVRARLGYNMGNFMPYLTGGLAWARSSGSASASISGTFVDFDINGFPVGSGVTSFVPASLANRQRLKIDFGYALGAGLDFALTSNIFLRAEVQHLRFASIAGALHQINTARVAAAIKY